MSRPSNPTIGPLDEDEFFEDDATSDTGPRPHDLAVPGDGRSEGGDGETLVYAPAPLVGDGEAAFDYAAFESSLDAKGRTPAPVAEPRVEAPRTWVTVPRRVRAEDATHSARAVGRFTVVTLQGRINESFDAEGVAAKAKGPVIFDLADVDRVTSFGVRGWLKMLQLANLQEAWFLRCSEHVVNQIAMIRNFCGPAQIHSLVAPYACESCGAEFGVVLHAVEHRELLLARRAPDVPCPECGKDTKMDEDPYVFFALDEHLVPARSTELEQAVEHLSSEARYAPVEKIVSGGVSRVRFNGEVGESTRFQRAFAGLEGDVVVDLGHARVTDVGARRLVEGLERLVDDVTSIVVEGATLDLGKAVAARQIPKVALRSVRIGARAASGIHRPVLVEFERNRDAIRRRAPVSVDEHWAAGGVTVDDPAALEALLGLAAGKARTPAPAAPAQPPLPPAGPSAMGAGWSQTPGPGWSQTPGPQSTYPPQLPPWGQGYPPGATPAPAPYVQPMVIQAPAPAAPAGNPQTVLIVALVAAVFAAVVAGVAVVLLVIGLNRAPAPAPAPAAPAPVAAQPAPAPASGWSTGGAEPPSWAREAALETGTHVVLVGRATGATVDEARAKAREQATVRYAQYLRQTLGSSPAGAGLPKWPLPEAAGDLAAALASAPALSEAESATRSDAPEAAVRFEVPKQALTDWLAPYVAVHEFKGMKFAEAPPWATGVRLVASPSWYDVPAGSRLVDVGGSVVPHAADVAAVAGAALDAVPEGGKLVVAFRDGERAATAEIQKRADRPQRPAPAPATGKPKLWSNPAEGQ